LLNAIICCSQLNTCGVLGLIRHRWIISHRCSWMAVYVFCCNAESKSHSDLLDISRLSLFYQLPNCNLFTQHVLFILWRDTLVNCGPRSYFHHIAITCLLYSHTLLFSTRCAHNLCFKQTGEIDNLIISWEQSTWLCVCRFHVAASKQSLDEAPYINCPKLSQTSKHHL
jgi:hypothetical protein